MAQGEPNLEGAIKVLVDLLTANSFTMTRSPYANNFRGLVDALLDLKEGFPTFVALQVGFNATAFQDVTDGDALFMRTADGQVGKASAANGTLENAVVVGFANNSAVTNGSVKVIVAGTIDISGLDAGDLYFLSPTTAGAVTLTPPSGSGQAITRVGEAATTTKLATHIEAPILLV